MNRRYKKYELLKNDSITVGGLTLHRIVALKDFGIVRRGMIGGYIQYEENLSHNGNCWVGENAKAYGYAAVRDNAIVYGNSLVSGNAEARGNAKISGYSILKGDSVVCNGIITDNTIIKDDVYIDSDVRISGDSEISGCTCIYSPIKLYGNADIKSSADYIFISGLNVPFEEITFFKCADKSIRYFANASSGSLHDFEMEINKYKYAKNESMCILNLVKTHFNLS